MKRIKEKKLTFIFIIIAILIVVVIALLLLVTPKKEEGELLEDTYKGWIENIEPNTYMRVNDSKNTCDKKYYTSLFQIKDRVLYDYKKIENKMFTLIPVLYSDCNIQLMFVSSVDGDLYYINNDKDSKLGKYELVKIDDTSNIIRLDVNQENHIISHDYTGTEEDITDRINEKINLEEMISNK